jgi:large subunit ribosomal protein L15
MSKLQNLKPSSSQSQAKKRIGRGNGSCGTFAGRGMNGQNSRTGGGVRRGFEGGQTPLFKKLGKLKGFKAFRPTVFNIINLSTLEEKFESGATVDQNTLTEKGLIDMKKPTKLLGKGELTKKLTITVDKASESAVKAVESAGGSVNILAAK